MTRITVNCIISSFAAHCHNIWYFSLNTSFSPERGAQFTVHEHATKPPVCPKFMLLNSGTAPHGGVGTNEGGRGVWWWWFRSFGDGGCCRKVSVNDHQRTVKLLHLWELTTAVPMPATVWMHTNPSLTGSCCGFLPLTQLWSAGWWVWFGLALPQTWTPLQLSLLHTAMLKALAQRERSNGCYDEGKGKGGPSEEKMLLTSLDFNGFYIHGTTSCKICQEI